VQPKDQNLQLNFLQNTQKRIKNAHAGGTLQGMTVPVAKARITSNVDFQCTSTATRRKKTPKNKWAALVSATTSSHFLGKDFLAFLILPILTVLGVLPVGSNVNRTRTPDLTQRLEADVKMVRIRTTAKVNKETVSTSLAAISTLNASSRSKSVGTSHIGDANVVLDTKGMAFSARMEMVL